MRPPGMGGAMGVMGGGGGVPVSPSPCHRLAVVVTRCEDEVMAAIGAMAALSDRLHRAGQRLRVLQGMGMGGRGGVGTRRGGRDGGGRGEGGAEVGVGEETGAGRGVWGQRGRGGEWGRGCGDGGWEMGTGRGIWAWGGGHGDREGTQGSHGSTGTVPPPPPQGWWPRIGRGGTGRQRVRRE